MIAYQVPREAPRRNRVSPWAFVPLVVPFLILLAVALFATYRWHTPTKTPPPGTRGSLVWGDAIFANRTEVKAWMTLHGASYESWARHHPAALRLLLPAVHPRKK
jgi:hypothetical protein